MIRIVVSVAAFALALLLVLVSGLRLPFLGDGNQPSSNQQQRSRASRLLDRVFSRGGSPSPQSPTPATGYSNAPAGQGQPNPQSPKATQDSASPTGIAPQNAPPNPRADGVQIAPDGTPQYSGESTSSVIRGSANDRPPTSGSNSTQSQPVRGGW